MTPNAQLAKNWVDRNVVLAEHCDIEYSDLYSSLEALLDRATTSSITQQVASPATEQIELPPVRSDLHDIEKLAQPSETVLIRIKGQAGVLLGRYIHGAHYWQADNIHGEVDVLEWWSLPTQNSGHSTVTTA